jgi:hypothetical protein
MLLLQRHPRSVDDKPEDDMLCTPDCVKQIFTGIAHRHGKLLQCGVLFMTPRLAGTPGYPGRRKGIIGVGGEIKGFSALIPTPEQNGHVNPHQA